MLRTAAQAVAQGKHGNPAATIRGRTPTLANSCARPGSWCIEGLDASSNHQRSDTNTDKVRTQAAIISAPQVRPAEQNEHFWEKSRSRDEQKLCAPPGCRMGVLLGPGLARPLLLGGHPALGHNQSVCPPAAVGSLREWAAEWRYEHGRSVEAESTCHSAQQKMRGGCHGPCGHACMGQMLEKQDAAGEATHDAPTEQKGMSSRSSGGKLMRKAADRSSGNVLVLS
eukprot:1144867-Pelagomonas_calceolata.AAC.4